MFPKRAKNGFLPSSHVQHLVLSHLRLLFNIALRDSAQKLFSMNLINEYQQSKQIRNPKQFSIAREEESVRERKVHRQKILYCLPFSKALVEETMRKSRVEIKSKFTQ